MLFTLCSSPEQDKPAIVINKHELISNTDIALMAHLLRRAGFGSTRAEIEACVEQGYEATVEQLLHPAEQPDIDEYTLFRYHPAAERPQFPEMGQFNWLYRMVNSQRPLQEKMALFWHHVFATGNSKVEGPYQMQNQINLFRESGLGNLRDLLAEVAKNPAMLYWLDNNENHKRAPNENWGRELLELFSMGVGNYTEEDVYEASRAFTGWTMAAKVHWLLWGPHLWQFEYRGEDHDTTKKRFLGEIGRFNGEDIVDIIVKQPACHIFIARHLYNFFVADEPQVPAWAIEPPGNPEAVETLAKALIDSELEMKPVLRILFNSSFFKEAIYKKVRNPAELAASTIKLTGDLNVPDPKWIRTTTELMGMGQSILDPPTVEGWHTGKEWINSGALMTRINFAADRVSNTNLPGVKDIVRRIAGNSNGKAMTPEDLVNHCLNLIGPIEVTKSTRRELVRHAKISGPINWKDDFDNSERRVGELLALISGTTEYQFG